LSSLSYRSSSVYSPDLHSFPTRRSSDLDVTIVLVVRDQLSLLNSVYLQRVKSLTLMPSFSEYVDRSLALGRFDLERSFAQWYDRSEEHTSELQSRFDLVCRLLLEKKKVL